MTRNRDQFGTTRRSSRRSPGPRVPCPLWQSDRPPPVKDSADRSTLGVSMRKCYLCGSLIRKRAEYCRFCTVRQPAGRTSQRRGGPHTESLSTPRPPASTPPEDVVWPDPPERRAPEPPVVVIAPAQPTDPIEMVVPDRASAPVPAPDPVPVPDPVDSPGPVPADSPAPVDSPPPIDPPRPIVTVLATVDAPSPVPPPPPFIPPPPLAPPATEDEAPGNDHASSGWKSDPSGSGNGHGHAEPGSDQGNGSVEAIAHPNGNGNGSGKTSRNGHVNGNGDISKPCASDHLRGFADFPNAEARPKVRWG